MTTIEVIGIVVTALLAVNFSLYLRSGAVKKDYACLRTLRSGKWAAALVGTWVVLLAVILAGMALTNLWPQVMGWSWLKLVATPAERPTAGSNILLSGFKIPWVAWPFAALFAINVPRLALNEEYAFRKGYKRAGPIVFQSLRFGLAHCLVGIPIAYGFGLSLAGGWFALQYLRGGVRRSGAYHCLHNWTLLALAVLWLAGLLR